MTTHTATVRQDGDKHDGNKNDTGDHADSTDIGADATAEVTAGAWTRPRGPRARGRHRRRRPRKALLAAGGLAVAAGVLSLVRLTPESGPGGLRAAEAEPHATSGHGSGRSAGTPAGASATTGDGPATARSTTVTLDGVSAAPVQDGSAVPMASPSAAAATAEPSALQQATTVPTALPEDTDPPERPEPTEAPRPSTGTAPAPRPTPAPSRSTQPPAPPSGGGGLCLPIIGLCVGVEAGPGR
ncbi:hypothetical protein [Streptomyces sp. HYC2]|uniref:hypothetical protein n=1 Tax=Streptomyces sp. HYC2 TaxID=2955207 RepID=UPI002480F16C|nr:hypothetical protein [Streptomyces sp. HYC2]